MNTIAIYDYNKDLDIRKVADDFMAAYGYDPKAVDRIEYDETMVRFRVLKGPSDSRDWYQHER